jgi:hypothetical protein
VELIDLGLRHCRAYLPCVRLKLGAEHTIVRNVSTAFGAELRVLAFKRAGEVGINV